MKSTRQIIVLAEDDESLRALLALRLRTAGYSVIPVGDGTVALEAIGRSHPAAVVSDIEMPGLDGLSLCRIVRRIAPGTPVILMTAYRTASVRAALECCEASAVLHKPFAGGEIVMAIEEALNATPVPPA